MKIFLAGECSIHHFEKEIGYDFYRLDTFYSMSFKNALNIHKYKGFILDSGAFSFIKSRPKNADWDNYIERYALFINKYNIELFFELDIDILVGIKEVERLREKLEYLTNKRCIPVWHRSRGKDYWLKLIKEYNYVAIGGIAIKTIKKEEFIYLSWFLNEAKKENCKVHGLGFTYLDFLERLPFYSVDSSYWIYGNLNGYVNRYLGKLRMDKINVPRGKKLKSKEVAEHNFKEWLKLQRYADKYLL